MAGSASSLNDHPPAGGPHHQIQIRPIFSRRQPGQHSIQRGQVAGVKLLFRGPCAQSLQDGASRFQHQGARRGSLSGVIHQIGGCVKCRGNEQGLVSLDDIGGTCNRR